MADRQGIEIDYCPQCRGVWLDRGELDKIIERTGVSRAPAAEPQQSRYEESGRDGHRSTDDRYNDKRHRKRSSLFDLFDFD
jgi:Zn-finger nucleic acid-binding protein